MSFSSVFPFLNDPSLGFIGLDCETSGVSLQNGHVLIQAGLAGFSSDNSLQIFSSLAKPSESFPWDESSAEIHGISKVSLESAPSYEIVDSNACAFINRLYPDLDYSSDLSSLENESKRTLYAVGFNVGSFDFLFFDKFLPSTLAMFSHRTVDLNSLCLLLHDLPFEGQARSWLEWKVLAKNNATVFLSDNGITGLEHDAGFDAALALGCFFFLRSVLSSLK